MNVPVNMNCLENATDTLCSVPTMAITDNHKLNLYILTLTVLLTTASSHIDRSGEIRCDLWTKTLTERHPYYSKCCKCWGLCWDTRSICTDYLVKTQEAMPGEFFIPDIDDFKTLLNELISKKTIHKLKDPESGSKVTDEQFTLLWTYWPIPFDAMEFALHGRSWAWHDLERCGNIDRFWILTAMVRIDLVNSCLLYEEMLYTWPRN